MRLTEYHAKYFAHDLTRRASGGLDRLSMSLFDAAVDLNPHQIEAALFALESPLSKGVILADEVGLGKTIEAGIVLCQFWAERKRRLLVICPASLRKQWALELQEKFNLPAVVLDAKSLRELKRDGRDPLSQRAILVASFHFANALREDLKAVAWDLVVIDEAHKLRNAYRPSNKVGQGIRWAMEDCRKLLLTATPLQNSLLELYGLSTLIDERLFGDVNSFRAQYTGAGSSLEALRGRLAAFCKRTLRNQVTEYIRYTERRPITRPFRPTDDEHALYEAVSSFLQRENSYALPKRQRHLTALILRKLLASSSKAIAATLDTLRGRLETLRDDRAQDDPEFAEQLINGEELEGVVPKHISVMETLNIFGIRADYMAQFRDFLEEEGLPTNDDRVEFLLPVIKNLGTQKLRIIRLKKEINGVSTEFGDAFRTLGPVPTLAKPDPSKDKTTAYLQKNQVILNWYPKIQALKSGGAQGGDVTTAPNRAHLTAGHVAFLEIDELYFELERFKAERGWYNLNLTRDSIPPLLADQTWYLLLIPSEELAFDSFDKVRSWQDIALSLLKRYTERYYTFRKREWELPHLEYQDLSENDPNFIGAGDESGDGYYRILLEQSQTEIAAKLAELKALIEKGDLKPWEFSGLKAIWFGRHLYEPLLYLDQKLVEISPVPLNKGERQFVEDLKTFHSSASTFFSNKELYLLRNLSKGKGVGFFEAGNFHPDFILWLLMGDRQHIAFVDPKGIRHLGATDPKVQFHETIKEIQHRLGDPTVLLNAFIVSNTPSHTMSMFWGLDKAAMQQRHILFQEEDKDTYVRTMLDAMA